MDKMEIYRFHYFLNKFEKLAGSGGILPTLKANKLYYFLVPLFMAAELLSLLRLIKRIKPDIIHAHWIIPQGIVSAIASIMFGVPYVLTTMGGDIYSLQGKLFRKCKEIAINRSKSITVLSNDMVREIADKLNVNKSPVVIPLGVDTSLFHPNRYDDSIKAKYSIKGPLLLFVGRLAEKKGVTYLISAMSEVVKENIDAKLLIIGDGPLRQELYQQAKSLRLNDHIYFVGPIPNEQLPKYYATADVFIGPSIQVKSGDTEGLGVTFIEAISSGCLTIATNVGGIGDSIIEGVTGYIVCQKSDKDLAQAIINALKQDSKLIRSNALSYARNEFDWNSVINKYIEILS